MNKSSGNNDQIPLTEEQVAHLLIKKIMQELSEPEKVRLQAWADASAENKAQLEELTNMLQLKHKLARFSALSANEPSSTFVIPTAEPHAVLSAGKAGAGKSASVVGFKRSWYLGAAAVIIMLTAGFYLWTSHKRSEQALADRKKYLQTDMPPGRNRAILTLADGRQIMLDSTQGNIVKKGSLTVVNRAGKLQYEGLGQGTDYNTIFTPRGGQYQIVLPDGSKVWLNAASSIKFPTAFADTTRNVEMTGEAYMEIVKKASQPFIVKANGAEIRVLGTRFNVNAYKDESSIRTTLIEGSVKVTGKSNGAVVLHPGQQAVLTPDDRLKLQTADTEQTLAWKNGIFQFNQTDLDYIMRQIMRWYDVEVVYENGIPDIKLDGDMKRDLTLFQMMEALSELGVKLRMEGKQVVIMK
jgi:transmembrane sensor